MVNLKGFYGFTLAEVLITLVIVGVIAAMTIPMLMNKTNNQEYVSRLKKTYSAFTQVTNKIIAENGSPKNWITDGENFYNLYRQYLSKAKDCGPNTGCLENTYKHLNGSNGGFWDTASSKKKLILSDGTLVMFIYRSKNCDSNLDGSYSVCGQINVDINGAKGPNMFGRDYFEFAVKEDGIYPMGCDYDQCTQGNSTGCACKVLREGAMNY